MLIVERQQRLLEILRERKAAQLEALSDAVGVSVSTVRRDLEHLEAQGLVERTHGGAVFRGPHKHSMVFAERLGKNVEQKQAIGRVVAELVQPNMTVLLDGGSTVYLAAQQIDARPLQVVTNSLLVAGHFADDEQVELMLIGGNLYPRSGVMVGPIARRCLHDLHADLLLFSLAGIFEDGCYNQNLAMAEIEQVMMGQAARSLLLMDSSKFGRKSLARVCGVEQVEQIITDNGVSPRFRRRFGDRLAIAE
jgi:DeoR family fructose operon transcriptional repressor